MIQPTFINLHTNEYTPGWHYYPFVFNLGRYVRSCNIYDLSNNVWVNIETEDLNLNILNMITGITEQKTLASHISCECKCKLILEHVI